MDFQIGTSCEGLTMNQQEISCFLTLSRVMVCFLPVVTRLTSSRSLKALTLDLNCVGMRSFSLRVKESAFLSKVFHLLLGRPVALCPYFCMRYFLTICPDTNWEIICLSRSSRESVYLLIKSLNSAVWNLRVFRAFDRATGVLR